MLKKTFIQKNNGDKLEASEWNELTSYANDIVDAVNQSANNNSGNSSSGGSSLPNIYINSKGNFNIETSPEIGNTSKGKINIESMDDIQLKPGDDIILYSHHRALDKQDEVAVKVTDGDDIPVKLQLNAAEMLLTTKDKTGANADVFDVTVNSAANNRGYLKVRAQAIDLRCEKHGGIALQPKGYDGDGNMNKIKFEHGGGDGLEFGTFNTEKTSIFTDEYRFNKDGVWKMATRQKVASNKPISNEGAVPTGKPNTADYKYVKQADDFYDVIADDDETASTNAIIKTAHALNDGKNRHAKYTEKVTSKGELKKTLEIETVATIRFFYDAQHDIGESKLTVPSGLLNTSKEYTISDFKAIIKGIVIDEVAQKYGVAGESGVTLSAGDVITYENNKYGIIEDFPPSIDITSGRELSIDAKEGTLSLGGDVIEFGSDTIELGEMEDGLYAQYKLTKKNNAKPCDLIKIKAINNQTTPLTFNSDAGTFAVESFYPGSDENHPANVQIPGKIAEPTTDEDATQHIQVIAQCKLMDVVKFVAWAKNTGFGPWASE